MENTEQQFKELLTKEEIKDIQFYSFDGKFLEFDAGHTWLLAGGVEFIFENHTISFGWNSEMHLYEIIKDELDPLIGEMDAYELELSEQANITKMKGKKIADVSFKWTWYQAMNEEMEVSDEKTFIPMEIKIQFEDNTKLQLASILFDPRNRQLETVLLDSQGTMLVSVDKEINTIEPKD